MEFAIDAQREQLPATGAVRAVGTDVPDTRPTEAGGHPLWDVDVFVRNDSYADKPRTEIVTVRLPAPRRPSVAKYRPLALDRPRVRFYLDPAGVLRVSITAAGLVPDQGKAAA